MSECVCCQAELTDLETFGDPDTPMCWTCWSTLEWEDGVAWHVKGDLFPVLGFKGLYCFYDERGVYQAEVKR